MTQEQIDSLNAAQDDYRFHPLTCPGGPIPGKKGLLCEVRTLKATADGWVCPGCGYTQPFGGIEGLILNVKSHDQKDEE